MKHFLLIFFLVMARVSLAGITTAGGVIISTPLNNLDGSGITNVTAVGGSNGVYGGVGHTNGVVYGNGASITNITLNNITNVGTAAYSNATAFYLNSNPSNYITTSVTNGLATTNYVNTSIANKTNFDNITVTNYSQFQTNAYFAGNIYVTNHAYDVSTSRLDPLVNEFVTAEYVQSVMAANFDLYFATNLYGTTLTNGGGGGTFVPSTMVLVNPANSQTNTISAWTNGTYFVNRIQTNSISYIQSVPINLYTYVQITGGGSVTAHPEIWLYQTNGTLIKLGYCADNDYSSSIAVPVNLAIALTNTLYLNTNLVNNEKLLLRWYVTTTQGNPTWRFIIGGGSVAHISVGTIPSANQNYVGTFTGNGVGLTNIPTTGITGLGTAAYSNATAFRVIGNTNFPGIYVTNSLVLGDFKMDGSADTLNFRRGNNSYPAIAHLYYDGDNNRIGGSVLDGFAGDFLYVPDGAPYLYVVDSYNSVQAIQAATLQLFGTGYSVNASTPAPYPLDVYAEGIGGQFGGYTTVARFGGYSAANVFIDASASAGNAASLVLASWDLNTPAGPYGYYIGTQNDGNFRISQMATVDETGYTDAKDFSGGLTGSLTLDKTGKIGIGTITPAYMFDVNGSGHFVGAVKFDANITGALTNLAIYNSTNYNGVLTNSTIRNATITNSTYYGNGAGLTNVSVSYSNITNAYGAFAPIIQTNLTVQGATVSSFTNSGLTGVTCYVTNATPRSFQVYFNSTGGSITIATNIFTVNYNTAFPTAPNPIWGFSTATTAVPIAYRFFTIQQTTTNFIYYTSAANSLVSSTPYYINFQVIY